MMTDPKVMGECLFDTKQAAAFLNVSPRTLEDWRWRGGGPLFRKLGQRLVRYSRDDLSAFIARNTYANTGMAQSER
jgi:hypothetical protein